MKPYHFLTATAVTTPSRETADTWSLVLWATNIAHEVVPGEDGFLINVDMHDLENARRQLHAFEEENSNWPPKPTGTTGKTDASQPPTVLLMGALVLLYAITGPWADGSPWFANGAVIGDRILTHGEWWRLVTALTLHSNAVHLLGNILIGGFLVHFLLRSIGNGLGVTLSLVCGAIGNYINILVHGPAHNSIGFSTAVFATIGILTGLQCIRKRNRVRAMLPPLAAGFGLLAMLGSSGEHTDLGAHLFGLIVGLVAGTALALIPRADKLIAARRLQTVMFFFSLCVVALCWGLTFRSIN